MRFIFGLIMGAVATLVVATAMDAPTQGVMQKLSNTWNDLQTYVQPADRDTDEDSAPLVSAPLASAALARPTESSPEEISEALTQEVSALPPVTPAPIPSETEVVEENVQDLALESDLAEDQEWKTETHAPMDIIDPVAMGTSTENPGEGIAWSPFHSEASATGFANRLTRALTYPFEVRKRSAADYLVTYSYADEAQRLDLEQKIARVTGGPSS